MQEYCFLMSVMTLFTGSEFSVADCLVAVGELRRRHGCTLECAEEILFLIRQLLPDGNNCPSDFSRQLLALESGDLDARRIHCCPCDSHLYEDPKELRCPECGATRYRERVDAGGRTRRPRKAANFQQVCFLSFSSRSAFFCRYSFT